MNIWVEFHRNQALLRSCLPELASPVNLTHISSPLEAGGSSTAAARARWLVLLLWEAEVAQSGGNSSEALRPGDFPLAHNYSRFEMDSCLGDLREVKFDDIQKLIGIHCCLGTFEAANTLAAAFAPWFDRILRFADLSLAASARQLDTGSHCCLAYSSASIEIPLH